MRFLWFWTFWHWSRESHRGGALLRGPVLGIGGHWDEWFRHEASPDDREAIAEAGADPLAQRRFILWLARHWAREAEWRGRRPPIRFVLRQLAPFPPFDRWPAMAKWRAGYGVPGVSAIVLAEGSAGEASDVYAVEALALHADAEPAGRRIVPEGFRADPADLETARQAAFSLLGGRGLVVLLALWAAGGRRPYPRWLGAALGVGWLAVGALIVRLLVGADPGGALVALSATLVALWLALALTATVVAGVVAVGAWRGGRTLRRRLEQSEVRLRMDGGLTIHGASAGLAFCLDTVLALFRAEPAVARRSWLWWRLFLPLRTHARSWAATGVVTADARVKPVVLAPKLRATLRHSSITQLVTPRQRGASARATVREAAPVSPATSTAPAAAAASTPVAGSAPAARLGFAAEPSRLHSHPCRHAAQAVMAIGGLSSAWQKAVNGFALVVSAVVVTAVPDLRAVLDPAPAPPVTAPASNSPYFLWVSLATDRPNEFVVELESGFWANRTAGVRRPGAGAPPRAELRLHRLSRPTATGIDDGTVRVARRRRFLTREFVPGEYVGRYTFSYVSRIQDD